MRTLLAGLLLLTLSGCSGESDEREGASELTVTVVKGIEVAPVKMQRAQQPAARHLAASEVVLYASGPMYSGSCPPIGEVEESGDDTLTLTIRTEGGICTSDANRYTFLIQGFTILPARLVVIDEGQEPIELDLSD